MIRLTNPYGKYSVLPLFNRLIPSAQNTSGKQYFSFIDFHISRERIDLL